MLKVLSRQGQGDLDDLASSGPAGGLMQILQILSWNVAEVALHKKTWTNSHLCVRAYQKSWCVWMIMKLILILVPVQQQQWHFWGERRVDFCIALYIFLPTRTYCRGLNLNNNYHTWLTYRQVDVCVSECVSAWT